nr:chromosome segregation protein SMC [Bifidobacterium sp. CP2]
MTLRGFKSFASATTLRFEPGITAVVGPNGSGKSNIVDALTWVMGEQGVRNLRGSNMEDVIFAGTSSRPPLGRAQVSLTIDNTDRALDIDYTEVTISRTIFRNGGSEYAINGSPCRLLDIQELLSDTGLGQQMHVIVGQGRLDSILRADPAGHRAFIEEAAGILKHRKRKERALRKLANTQTNLERLDDLLGEIRRQLGPLGRQARISRRADAIQVSLRDARSRIYADDAVDAMRRRDRNRAELAAVRGDLAKARRELAQTNIRIEQVETQVGRSNPAIDKVNQTWRSLSQLRERFDSLASIADERGRSLLGRVVTNPGEDPDLLDNRAAELERQTATQTATANDMRLALDQATERRAGDEKRLASIRQTLAELRRTTRERDARIARLRELVAREETAVQSEERRIADLNDQRAAFRGQLEEARAQRLRLQDEAETVPDDGRELDEARSLLAERRDALNAALDAQRAIRSKIISLKAKADALQDTLSGRNASGMLEADDDTCALGRLADFIHVRDGWEEAVARALGVYANAVVVPEASNMLHALEHAREERLGQAVVIRLNGTGDAAEVSDDGDVTSAGDASVDGAGNGDVAMLSTYVDANPDAADAVQAARVAATVRTLVADTAVADTADEAQRIVTERLAARAATHAGELFTASVAAVGGSVTTQSDLSLAARRDKALHDVAALERQAVQADADVAAAKTACDQAARQVDEASRRRTEARLKAEQAAKALKDARRRVDDAERRLGQFDERLAKAKEDVDTHRGKLADLRQSLHAAEHAEHGDTDPDELSARERELETALSTARDQEVATKIAWTEADRKAESLRRQAALLRGNAKEARERRARIEESNARLRDQAARAVAVAADARAASHMVEEAISKTVEERERLRSELSGHDEELRTLRTRRAAVEPTVGELSGREHALDVERERIAAEYEQVVRKAGDELGMDVDALVESYGPDKPVPVLDDDGDPIPLETKAKAEADTDTEPEEKTSDGTSDGETVKRPDADAPADATAYRTVPYVREEQVKRLEKAQRDLARLGKVNPLATEEYEALTARNKYLNDQRDDIMRSREDLMRLVKDLDATMVDVFCTAFEDTAKAFEQVFATLFPGGTGRLRLENPDDMLSTGVIVEASPAGKRVKQLSLLSGGERSLTALALLFAIFTARPSPFYVMDEVEAALDDVNLTRLLDAIEGLREHAQLIVITHQQRTMAIADALYGVTMRADGVTAVVSQRLPRRTPPTSVKE